MKATCREIGELDPLAPISETRMKRINIHGLKLELRSFVATIQGWPIQPSLVEFENLLAAQETLAKQMGGGTDKTVEKALYVENVKQSSRAVRVKTLNGMKIRLRVPKIQIKEIRVRVTITTNDL